MDDTLYAFAEGMELQEELALRHPNSDAINASYARSLHLLAVFAREREALMATNEDNEGGEPGTSDEAVAGNPEKLSDAEAANLETLSMVDCGDLDTMTGDLTA